MPKKAARVYECRDGKNILCPTGVVEFRAHKEGGQIRITNRGKSPIKIAEHRRAVPPGGTTLIAREEPLMVGERKFICK